MRKITTYQYAVLLYEITREKSEISKIIKGFFGLLAKNNDLGKTAEIIKEFEKYEKKQKEIKDVEIISAKPIAKDIKTQILEAVGGKTEVKEVLDPDLIGGVVVTIGDMMIDGSLRRKLRELSKLLA